MKLGVRHVVLAVALITMMTGPAAAGHHLFENDDNATDTGGAPQASDTGEENGQGPPSTERSQDDDSEDISADANDADPNPDRTD